MVLLSAQAMDVAMIAQVTFTGRDHVRDVIHSLNTDGFDALRPKCTGDRPPKFDTDQRETVKRIALVRPTTGLQPWIDLKYAPGTLIDGTVTIQQWEHPGVASVIWLLIPLSVGPAIVVRAEVK